MTMKKLYSYFFQIGSVMKVDNSEVDPCILPNAMPEIVRLMLESYNTIGTVSGFLYLESVQSMGSCCYITCLYIYVSCGILLQSVIHI